MSLARFINTHARRLEAASMAVMAIGLCMACQPISLLLFKSSVAVMLVGLVGFNIFARIPSADHPHREHT